MKLVVVARGMGDLQFGDILERGRESTISCDVFIEMLSVFILIVVKRDQ